MAQLEVKQSAMSWWELSPACLTGASAVNPGIHCMTLAKLADLGQIVEMRGGGKNLCSCRLQPINGFDPKIHCLAATSHHSS